eukprot:TRINITY_DN35122_c0_g1_i1.p1 TRINITY_DN35122_c0_g1~~TRINITY_DN35122_c0_g1_i1.p1  ORF type:complete len:188 (+),score=41.83 TRINITY_DN35122_c0_g1_i1:22-585(+)
MSKRAARGIGHLVSSEMATNGKLRCRHSSGFAFLLVVGVLAVFQQIGSLNFSLGISRQVTGLSRGNLIASGKTGTWPARSLKTARGDGGINFADPMIQSTLGASLAGLGFGIIISKVLEGASTASSLTNESLKARLSADAGMEDVDDEAEEDSKETELIRSMKAAQGLGDKEVEELKKKKVEIDEGW